MSGVSSLVPFTALTESHGSPYCTDDIWQQALAAGEENECYQRQEIKFQSPYARPSDKPYIYKFRFRMPAVIFDEKNSIRWVTAQWKQEPISPDYKAQPGEEKWDPSPVVAELQPATPPRRARKAAKRAAAPAAAPAAAASAAGSPFPAPR